MIGLPSIFFKAFFGNLSLFSLTGMKIWYFINLNSILSIISNNINFDDKRYLNAHIQLVKNLEIVLSDSKSN